MTLVSSVDSVVRAAHWAARTLGITDTEDPRFVFLKKGKTYQLKAVLTPFTSQQKVTFTSKNRKIASVNTRGKIKARKKGTTYIIVRSGRKKAVVKVIVR